MGKRLSVLSIVALVLMMPIAAGCGDTAGTSGTAPKTSAGIKPSTAPAGGTVSVFFMKGETATSVDRPAVEKTVPCALELLLLGPTDEEKARGLTTAIPAGTRLLGYAVDGERATADFSGEMLGFGGGSAMVLAIESQVEKTVTGNDPAIKAVSITVEGKPAEEVMQP